MTRADFARWLMLFAVCGMVVSAVAGSTIGVLLGATYIIVAITATAIDIIQKEGRDGYVDGGNHTANRRD